MVYVALAVGPMKAVSERRDFIHDEPPSPTEHFGTERLHLDRHYEDERNR